MDNKRTKTKKASTKKNPSKKSPRDLMEKYRGHKDDTGSTEVQITLFSQRINELALHLKEHPKDFDSKRGLLIILGKRRRLLNYLAKKDEDGKKYDKLIQDLGLRK